MSGPERFFSNCSRLGVSVPDSLQVVLDQRGLFPDSLRFYFLILFRMFMYWIKLSYGWLVYDSDITIAVTGIITVTSCIINNKLSLLIV